MLGFAVSQITI